MIVLVLLSNLPPYFHLLLCNVASSTLLSAARDEVSDDLSDLSPLEDENSTPVPLEVPVATHGRKRQERRKPKQQPPPDEAAESDEESSHVEEGRIERERSPERQKAEAAEQSEVKKQSQMIKQPRVKEERAGHPETP